VSASQIAVPGAFAGLTIFPGLPLGRVRAQMPRVKAFLKAPAIGMPIFLLWDVLTSAWEPVGSALGPHRYARVVADGSVMLACVSLGRMGPVLGFVTDALASAADGENPR
jgi:zinc transporter, ZIP family